MSDDLPQKVDTVNELRQVINPQPPIYHGALKFEPSLGTAQLVPSRGMFDPETGYFGGFFVGRTIENNVIMGNGPDAEPTSAPIFHRGEGHILICAETRSGKSERVLVPNLCLWPGSALVIDCKGALATMTAARRGPGNEYCDGMGQNVRVLDPEGISDVPDELRASINPLDWLQADDLGCINKARTLTSALIPENPNASEPYWTDEAREFLACLLVHVATDDRIVAERRNLRTVYDFMMVGDEVLMQAYVDNGVFTDEDGEEIEASGFEVLYASMQDNPVFLNYVSTYGSNLAMLFTDAKKQWLGIQSAAKQSLSWLTDPLMQEAMKESDVDFRDLKNDEHGATIYISVSDMSIYYRWVRMLVKMFNAQSQTFDAPATDHQTLVVLDEFSSLKAMPEMSDLIDKSAEYGVRMCIVIQRLSQLKKHYPADWEQFISASDLRFFFGIEEETTCAYLEKSLGDIEVIRTTRNASHAEGVTEQHGVSRGTSRMHTHTTGKADAISANWNKGENENSSNAHAVNKGKGSHHKQTIVGFLAGRLVDNPIIMPGDKNYSSSVGDTTTIGSGRSAGVGGGTTSTINSSDANAEGTSEGETDTWGKSETYTVGLNESVHKRPLIAFAEFPSAFTKVVDRTDPRFPGQALVIFRGGIRGVVRTSIYYEDPLFYRTYSKHPKYEFIQAPLPWTEIKALEEKERRVQLELDRRFSPYKMRIEAEEEAARQLAEKLEREEKQREYERSVDEAVQFAKDCRDNLVKNFAVSGCIDFSETYRNLLLWYEMKCKIYGGLVCSNVYGKFEITRTIDGQLHTYHHPLVAPCDGSVQSFEVDDENHSVSFVFLPRNHLEDLLEDPENVRLAAPYASSPHEAAQEIVNAYYKIEEQARKQLQNAFIPRLPTADDYRADGEPGLAGEMLRSAKEGSTALAHGLINLFIIAAMLAGGGMIIFLFLSMLGNSPK